MEEAIIPGRNGLPPRKAKNGEYTPEEKAIIVSKAAEIGTHAVANAYGFAWQTISSWKRFYGKEIYGKESDFDNMSKKKKNKPTTKNSSVMKANVTESTIAPMEQIAPGNPVAQLIIQSPSGQEITPEEVRAKVSGAVGVVERVYIRADESKAYWVRGEEHGAVDLW